MKYYISQTEVTIEDGKITGYEMVLTKPDIHKPTLNMLRKMKRLEIENIHLCAHPKISRRYGRLLRAQNKRHKAKHPRSVITAGDLAKMTEQADKELSLQTSDK